MYIIIHVTLSFIHKSMNVNEYTSKATQHKQYETSKLYYYTIYVDMT